MGDGIEGHVTPCDRIIERAMKHPMNVSDRLGRQPAARRRRFVAEPAHRCTSCVKAGPGLRGDLTSVDPPTCLDLGAVDGVHQRVDVRLSPPGIPQQTVKHVDRRGYRCPEACADLYAE
jgi:hypothetical protein